MLCISNSRTIAYLKALLSKDYMPSRIILLHAEGAITPGQKSFEQHAELLQLLDENKLDYEVINTSNLNSDEVVSALNNSPQEYVIYSGPGGTIVRENVLGTGKKFIHIHPGRLPEFKGSTTVYYHLLEEGTCGASAIFLEREIDTGPVIGMKTFDVPSDVDLDYDYDPMIRSELLVDVIEGYVQNGSFSPSPQIPGQGETYYIMHPVLRHIAKLRGK
jgi:methionyl-tRNA formyltransferase